MSGQRTRAFAADTAVTASLEIDSADSDFSWSEVRVSVIDNPPHETAFDTDRFYKIPMVAARPIEQTYNTQDGEVTMKKPAEELKAAAWSLDNAPITLDHPSTRIVDSVERIHGFVRNPEWDSDDQSLRADAYVPVRDSEAKGWIEDNDGVSIGFWYESDPSADGVDAYQRDLLVDHVAIVDEGRCSREDGCGLAADSAQTIRGFRSVSADGCSDGPCSCGLHIGTDVATGDFVKGSSSGGTWHGKVVERKTEGCFSERIDGDQEICADDDDPVLLIENYDDEDGEGTGTMVAHKESSVSSWNYSGDATDKSVEDIDLTVPDGAQSAAEAFLEAKDNGIIPDDCGTGEGTESAKMIAEGEVTAERLESDIAPYLNSHEEDTSTDEHPSNWPMGEDADTPWKDCGDAQYASWGWHSLTDWARRKADEIKRAKGEDTVYGTDRPTEDRHWTDSAKVSLGHQMAEDSVELDMAVAPAPYYIAIHDEGGEYTRQNVSVGGQLGRVGPYDAYEELGTTMVPFDEPIAEPRRVYAVLYYASETGDMADPIESQQGFVFDSAVVMPDESPDSLRRALRDSGIDVASLDDQLFGTDRSVAGVSFDGLREGDLDKSEIPNEGYEDHYLYPGDTKSESSYPVVDGDGMLRRGNVDAAHQLGARGGVDEDTHERKLRKLNEVFAESDDHSAPIDFETDTMEEDNDSPISVGDLTIDAVAEQHDGVAELQGKVDELETQLDAAKEELDEMSEELEAYRADEKQDIVDEITALTDAFGEEEELMEMEVDTLESHLELAKDMAADVAGGVSGDSAEADDEEKPKYTPDEVYDLSETA